MRVFFQKLRHIYVPFLIVTVGFVVTYSLLAWGLVYKTRLLVLDEELVTFWLPVGLASVTGWIWIWPRLGVLRLESSTSRFRELFLFLAVGTMSAPTVMGQMYLSKAAARVARLGEMTEISKVPIAKYYRLDNPCVRREGHQFNWTTELIGRHNESLKFAISVAVPFCDSSSSLATEPPAWLGITFSKTVPASLPEPEKERDAQTFARESEDRFHAMDLREFTYLELIGPGAKKRGFEAAIGKVDPVVRDHLVLEPHHEPFETRAGETGEWALKSFAIGALFWLLMLAVPDVHGAKLRQLADGTLTRTDRKKLRAFLVPSRGNFGTLSLTYLNVGVFLAMAFAGLGVVVFHLDDLVNWGACSRPLLHGWGVLRLVTSQFVHGGVMHILGNIYGLLFAGLMLEPIVGGRRLLLAYLVAGAVGGLASAVFHPVAITVGASGSILGLFGVLLVLAKDQRVASARKAILVNATIYVGLNLLLGAVSPGVDNAAHVGGLLAGVAMAPFLALRRAAQRTDHPAT